jgi:quinolinate synthase
MIQHPTTAEELYERLKSVKHGATPCPYDLKKCREMIPLINEINQLKKEKNAVILAHSYLVPEIIYGVADFTGDSYGLSKDATNTDADIIIFGAVHFMAETAKILNPEKEVLLPATDGGCSLADSITAEDVKALRAQYPDHTFICYINTTAEVKAQCDLSVTSANVYDIIEKIDTDKICFLPDKYMGKNIQEEMQRRGVEKEIVLWDGACYVHEEYTPAHIDAVKKQYPDVKILAHPECTSAVIHCADYVGSTTGLFDYIEKSSDEHYLLLTECGLASRIQVEFPDKHLVGACSTCKYMKSNSLWDILQLLKNPTESNAIEVREDIREAARKNIETMFYWAEK